MVPGKRIEPPTDRGLQNRLFPSAGGSQHFCDEAGAFVVDDPWRRESGAWMALGRTIAPWQAWAGATPPFC